MVHAKPATPESDALLAEEYRDKGLTAWLRKESRDSCPYDGLLKMWWLEGYDTLEA
jgi:ribosome modulation factor